MRYEHTKRRSVKCSVGQLSARTLHDAWCCISPRHDLPVCDVQQSCTVPLITPLAMPPSSPSAQPVVLVCPCSRHRRPVVLSTTAELTLHLSRVSQHQYSETCGCIMPTPSSSPVLGAVVECSGTALTPRWTHARVVWAPECLVTLCCTVRIEWKFSVFSWSGAAAGEACDQSVSCSGRLTRCACVSWWRLHAWTQVLLLLLLRYHMMAPRTA